MGQENSKSSAAPPAAQDAPSSTRASVGSNASTAAVPSASGAAAPTPLELELARMLHFHNPRGDDAVPPPRHVKTTQDIMAAYRALPAPRAPLIPWSNDKLVLSRHDRVVDDMNGAPWSVFVQSIDPPAADGLPAVALPPSVSLHRVFAAWETSDMQASQAVVAEQQRMGEAIKQLGFDAQLAKSTAMQRAAELTRSATLMQAADAELLSAGASTKRVAQLATDVAKLAMEIDAMLSPEDRAAVRAIIAEERRAAAKPPSSGSVNNSRTSFTSSGGAQ